ncbi:MAG: amylo-alpha-1,6-glucosidase [Kouleothrix sp.]
MIWRCVTPRGFRARLAGYPQIWTRDTGVVFLKRGAHRRLQLIATARAALETMSAYQSARGLISPNVNPDTGFISTANAGAVDSNLWYLLGHYLYFNLSGDLLFLERHWPAIDRAMIWLEYQT